MISKRTFLAGVIIGAIAFAAMANQSARLSGVASAQTAEQQESRRPGASGGLIDIIEQAKQAEIKAFAGSWEGVVTPEEGGPPPFRILFTFGVDGTVVVSDAGPPSPQNNTAEHGAWERTGDHEFTIIYKQFLFNGAGDLDSTFKGRVKFKLDENRGEISGPVKVDIFDLQGNTIIAGNGTVKCSKIRVERLD